MGRLLLLTEMLAVRESDQGIGEVDVSELVPCRKWLNWDVGVE